MSVANRTASAGGGDLVFIGDVHLEQDDPSLDDFLAFLDAVSATTSRMVLLGDLFNLWIGQRELEQPHQRVVVDKLQQLRRRGVDLMIVDQNPGPSVATKALGVQARTLEIYAHLGIAEKKNDLEHAKKAQAIASKILQANINYRDIRQRVEQIRELIKKIESS